MRVDNWLEELLEELGWSPSDLSRASGLDTAVISNIKNGRRNTGPEVAKKIAKATGRTVADIYERAGILPSQAATKDKWVRRIEGKLEQIQDENDRRTIEGLIDLLAPSKKIKKGSRAKNEGTS